MRQTRWRELLPLAPILVLAAILRVGWPTLTEFKFSEARLATLALDLTRDGRLPLVGVPSSAGFDHSPVSVYLYAPAFAWTTSPIPATIYGGLLNVAAVALCWFLARYWPGGGLRAAAVSSLLFAVSPWAVVSSRKIWQVAFVPLLTLAFVGWAVSGLIRGRRWSLCWGILSYAVLVQVHPSALLLAPALVLWLIVFRRQVAAVPVLVGSALGVGTAVPFLVHQIQTGWPVFRLSGTGGGTWDLAAPRMVWDVITGRGLPTLAGEASASLQVVPQLAWIYNTLGWLASLALAWLAWHMLSGWRKRTGGEVEHPGQVAFFLVTWALVPVTLSLWHSTDLYFHFFLLLAPSACLILGLTVEAIAGAAHSPKRRLAYRALLIGLTSVLLVVAALQAAGLALMGRFVATHDTAGGFGTPLGRYMDVASRTVALTRDSEAAEVLVVGQGDSVVVDETPAIFHALLRGQVPYRFVDGRDTALFPELPAVALLAPDAGEAAAAYATLAVTSDEGGFRLLHLEGALPDLPTAPIAGAALLQDGVELRGYAWRPSLGSGSPTRFWLLWRVAWRSAGDTHFFVHLVDQTGTRLGQRDMEGYPAANRHLGDEVLNLFDITVPAESTAQTLYWVRVGMYTYPELVTVPFIDVAGNPVSDWITIGPLVGNP